MRLKELSWRNLVKTSAGNNISPAQFSSASLLSSV